MARFTVNTEVFQGPFDLLLHLVSRKKVDIHALSLAEITDEYLDHIEAMCELDLDLASEFLLLASTLLEIKAASLLPAEEAYLGDELDDLSPEKMKEALFVRLTEYKKYKNVAAELSLRLENEGLTHPRQAGIEPEFLGLMPDFLDGITLHTLAVICAELAFKREMFLLEAEHVAPTPLSLEERTKNITARLMTQKRVRFSELIQEGAPAKEVVVTFLALLELYKRGILSLVQSDFHADIEIVQLSDEDRERLGIVEEFDEYN